jgi:exodeoxyribonuclease VII small subunit
MIKDNNIKFEDAISELEKITRELESGVLSLDQSLESYERAVSLIKLCNERLESAEKKVKILLEGANGEIVAEDFVGNEN